jgi:coniferyl-aldehyde dehydrogenase
MKKGASSRLELDLQGLLRRQQRSYHKQAFPDWSARQNRLDRVVSLLADNQHLLCDALASDFGGGSRHHFLASEILAAVSALKDAKKHLPVWMKHERRSSRSALLGSGGTAEIHYQPKGIVGVLASWRSPVWSSLGSLGSIFAAGNRCMVQISDATPHIAQLLEKLTSQYLDQEELVIVCGDRAGVEIFSRQAFDHLLFFGSGQQSKELLRLTAETMVPTTLILSGMSPAIVGKKVDLKKVASVLVREKCSRAGQGFFSAECVWVREHDLNELIAEMERASQSQFPGMLKNPDYGALLNQQHYQRMQDYLGDARSQGAEIWEINLQKDSFHFQPGRYKMPLTLVINPPDGLQVMRQDICGPVMVLKSYRHIDEVMEHIQQQSSNVVCYYFGRDPVEQKKILANTVSGAVVVNPIGQSVFSASLPLGANGTGYIQGVEGFRTFSHARSVCVST